VKFLLWSVHAGTLGEVFGLLVAKYVFVFLPKVAVELPVVLSWFWSLEGA
jgi:hypothetical protein